MAEVKKASLAKNTAVLYARMFMQMIVYLYTSRVIARVLGMEDWGIYDVVGGIVLVMAFLNNAMTVCSQRYLTYAIGYGDKAYLNRVLSSSLLIHILIVVLLVVLGETVGLWYLLHNIVIPDGRQDAALVVYHCSLASAAIMIVTVPFNALVIAYEKMTVFAAISVGDVLLKLIIIMSLDGACFDRLKVYAYLLLIETIIVRGVYWLYCNKSFGLHGNICRLRLSKKHDVGGDEMMSDRTVFINMLKFSGWSVLGNLSVVCNTQGINLLLNFIGGPLLNAARVIAFNVQTAITAFVASFQTAMNPRITKHYAAGETDRMNELVMNSSRISFMLIYIVALPVLIETRYILELWLRHGLPDYAIAFTRFLIVVSVFDAVANPLTIAVSATGQVKRYHLIIGGILLLVLPVAGFVTLFDKNPCLVFFVQVTFVCVAQVVRVFMCRNLFKLNIADYMKKVVSRIIAVAAVSALLPCFLHLALERSALLSWIIMITSVLATILSAFCMGLKPNERQMLFDKILRKKEIRI